MSRIIATFLGLIVPRLLLSAIVIAVAVSGEALAQTSLVKLSLNLRYNDPADPTEGGRWYLVAKTDSPNGIASVDAYLTNIDAIGMMYGTAAGNGYPFVSADVLGATVDGTKPLAGVMNDIVHVVYIQDLENGPIALNVGRGETVFAPGEVSTDPLRNPAWNGESVLISGPFGATRPEFATSDENSTSASVFTTKSTTPPVAVTSADVTTTVRGDSVAFDGLFPGDANRDGVVNSDDHSILALNYLHPLVPITTWNQGDFNDSSQTDADDFNLLALNFGKRSPPPAIAAALATPEPASQALIVLGVAAVTRWTRRQKRQRLRIVNCENSD